MKKKMCHLFCSLVAMACLSIISCGSDSKENVINDDLKDYTIRLSNVKIRDPFIFVDKKTQTYYLHFNPYTYKNLQCYSSKDLIHWKDEGYSFTAPADFWGNADYWAPDEYEYNGKYYLFVTFSVDKTRRGTSVLVSDYPNKDFKPLVNHALTPSDMMALDAAFWLDDDGQPWIIYCHEWLQVTDGKILVQKISKDLKETIGDPIELFSASEAPWVKSSHSIGGKNAYVTDAPFLYRASNGELLMIWSSTCKDGHYAVGVARSTSGKIEGPWIHDDKPLNTKSGGHAMIFKDLNNVLRISFHSPNYAPERVTIYKLNDQNGKLSLGLML